MLILGPPGSDANGFVPFGHFLPCGAPMGPGVGALIWEEKQKQEVTSSPGAGLITRFRACQPVALWIIPAQALRIGHVVICVRRSAAFIPEMLLRSLLERIKADLGRKTPSGRVSWSVLNRVLAEAAGTFRVRQRFHWLTLTLQEPLEALTPS